MHATTEQLLSYRDSEVLDASVKSHVLNCEQCLNELSQLRKMKASLQTMAISELNEIQLQENWNVVLEALDKNKKSVIKKFPVWAALAASVFAVGSMLLFSIDKDAMTELPEQLVESVTVPNGGRSNINSSTQSGDELARLVAYSHLLESRLQSMPQPRLVRANTAGTISQLEDQISFLDSRLNLDHQVPLTEQQRNALWQQRVSSMNNLYRVRSAQLQRVSY